MGSPQINKDLKDTLISTYRSILKQFKVKHKGILSLIGLFGDPETLVKEEKKVVEEREVPMMSIEQFERRDKSEDNTYRNSRRNRP